MTRLNIMPNYNRMHKRFMMEEAKSKRPVKAENRPAEISQDPVVEESQSIVNENPQPNIPNIEPETSWLTKIKDYLFSSTEITNLQNTINNEVTEPYQSSQELSTPLESYKFYTKEAAATDKVLKGIVAHLEVCDKKLNLEIKKSDKLRVEWQEIIIKTDKVMDEYKKATQPFWKKKWFTVSASILTIGFFLFQMYKYKAIPNFVGLLADVGDHVFKSTSKDTSTDIAMNIPKLNINETLKTIAETPIAPLTILTGIGIITVGLGTLRLISLILRKIAK